jgi:hypothetical protein
MTLIPLILFVCPHIALAVAWFIWARTPAKFQPPKWRSILLFAGLVAVSLNIVNVWAYVIWLNSQGNNLEWWKGRDKFESVSNPLIVFALLAAILGKGRARALTGCAAVFGYLVWVIAHIGIL